jgi:membrane protein implicated in regulation of membrane protease activity
MDGPTITWIFLIGGFILMVLELVLPSGISLILGFSGVLVAAIRWLGFLEDPITATLIWLLMSVFITLVSLPFIRRHFGGESTFKLANEDYEAMDQVVDVVESVDENSSEGRVRFQGISWQARSLDGPIPKGAKARIVYRDNTTWMVEATDEVYESLSKNKTSTN